MKQLSAGGRRRLYRVMCYLGYADGELAESERDLLDELAVQLQLRPADALALEDEAQRGQKIQLKADPAEANIALHFLAQLMVADGVLHPDEARRLKRVGQAMGLSDKQLAGVLNKALLRRDS